MENELETRKTFEVVGDRDWLPERGDFQEHGIFTKNMEH